MDEYYVSKHTKKEGGHELHLQNCYRLPKAIDRIYLGKLENEEEAVKIAKKYYCDIIGCYYCCPEIHKK